MKRTIFLSLIFLAVFAVRVSATDVFNKEIKTSGVITSLVVNSNVTVVLVTHPSEKLRMMGDQQFLEEVSIKQTEGKLIIDGNRRRNFKNRGVIYVPANHLQQIKINNAAYVHTASTLRIPNLKVVVNGDCKVNLVTLGKIDFVENDQYEVRYEVREKNNLESAVVKSRQY